MGTRQQVSDSLPTPAEAVEMDEFHVRRTGPSRRPLRQGEAGACATSILALGGRPTRASGRMPPFTRSQERRRPGRNMMAQLPSALASVVYRGSTILQHRANGRLYTRGPEPSGTARSRVHFSRGSLKIVVSARFRLSQTRNGGSTRGHDAEARRPRKAVFTLSSRAPQPTAMGRSTHPPTRSSRRCRSPSCRCPRM
jgi:hypothetical protein